jgi:hypothetical protein
LPRIAAPSAASSATSICRRRAERLDGREPGGVVVRHREGVIARRVQQMRDGLADLAGAEQDDPGHGQFPVGLPREEARGSGFESMTCGRRIKGCN